MRIDSGRGRREWPAGEDGKGVREAWHDRVLRRWPRSCLMTVTAECVVL